MGRLGLLKVVFFSGVLLVASCNKGGSSSGGGVPALNLGTTTVSDGAVGTLYSVFLSASGGVSPYSWSVSTGSLPTGLFLNSATGEIFGTPSAIGGPTGFTVSVTDSASTPASDSQPLNITIQLAPLAITTTTLPDGIQGTAYGVTLAASGGIPSYTWSISPGTLPAGLTLDMGTGWISGIPTAFGSPTVFTANALDSQGTPDSDSRLLSITINPDPNPPVSSITSPMGGELWSGTQTITWSTTDTEPNTVEIRLSTDFGVTYPTVVASVVPDIGSYSWDTTGVSDGFTYRVRDGVADRKRDRFELQLPRLDL